jgi:hypothetical protein
MFGLTDKNILWTYVPPEIDWIHNKNFYLIDLYCLCLSVKLFKTKFKCKSIKLYSNSEIIGFFKDTNYFDEFIDITHRYDIVRNQNAGFSHKNIMFKVFTACEQTEPFVHIDHDFFINNPNLFDSIDKDIVFSLIETVCAPDGNQKINSYSFYIKVFIDLCRNIDDSIFDNFNPMQAYNSSIFGCNGTQLVESFTKTKEFLLKYYEILNQIKDLPIVLEQFIQINYLLENHNYNDFYVFGDLIKGGNTAMPDVDIEIKSNHNYSSLDITTYNRLFEYFNCADIIHLSGYRWHPYYRILLVNLLKKIDANMEEKLRLTYGEYDWNTHSF